MTLFLPGTENAPPAVAFALNYRHPSRQSSEDASGEVWTYDADTETAYRTCEIEAECEDCGGRGEVECATHNDPFAIFRCRPCGGTGSVFVIPDGEWITEMLSWAERRAIEASASARAEDRSAA